MITWGRTHRCLVREFKRPFESELRFHIAPRTYQGRSTRSLGSFFERLWPMHKGALRKLNVLIRPAALQEFPFDET
jgi:hypothetical protein